MSSKLPVFSTTHRPHGKNISHGLLRPMWLQSTGSKVAKMAPHSFQCGPKAAHDGQNGAQRWPPYRS
eukprot:5915051-Pyramimonas_sp.AAC.1